MGPQTAVEVRALALRAFVARLGHSECFGVVGCQPRKKDRRSRRDFGLKGKALH